MSIAQNIRRLREEKGLTQEELATAIGMSRPAVTQWETGWSQPRMGTIEKLAAFFGVSKSEIIDDCVDRCHDIGAISVYSSGEATVPLRSLGRVHAGALTDEEEAERRVEVPASVLRAHPRAFALVVEGNCMDRVIPEGAHVLVDPDREPSNGSIAVVETEAYQAVMRRWYRGSSTLMLTADSSEEQEDIVFSMDDGPVRVIGTVVWYQAPEEME